LPQNSFNPLNQSSVLNTSSSRTGGSGAMYSQLKDYIRQLEEKLRDE